MRRLSAILGRGCASYALMLLLLLSPQLIEAQVKVTVSTEIISQRGRKMYVHYVKKGETVYSICKAYNISANELQLENPALSNGLKEGQILYIPVSPKTSSQESSASDGNKQTTGNTGTSGKTGATGTEVLKTQDANETEGIVNVQDGDVPYINHKVRWFEDLDDIAKKYGVSKASIKQFNGMTSDRLKGYKVLRIPQKGTNTPGEDIVTTDGTNTSTDLNNGNNGNNNGNWNNGNNNVSTDYDYDGYKQMPSIDTNRKRVVSLVLPMNAGGKINGNYMDFYAGALIAATQLKEEGANLQINVIDQGAGSSLESILNSEELLSSDLIIGPVRSSALRVFIPVADQKRIPIVSPLDASADSLLDMSSCFFQAPLSQERQNEALAEMIVGKSRELSNPNVLLVFNRNHSKDSASAESLKNILMEKGLYVDQAGYVDVLKGMKKTKDNIVIAHTTVEATAIEIVRNLDIQMIEGDKVTLFGTPRWKGFETIDMNLLFKYNLTLCMPYNVDLQKPEVRNFIRRYRALYKDEPSANSFSGYDIFYFFGRALTNGLYECMKDPYNYKALDYVQSHLLQQDMLQQKFDFVKSPQGAYVNRAAFKVLFNQNYTVTSE
ncbi:MAG: LysM peptidoglycan-binding domain-containing protein [Bacteroidales bacterium]|nr:LysM peptidoglycan-binding domain-containing protein [Bacteroidales bacterium]